MIHKELVVFETFIFHSDIIGHSSDRGPCVTGIEFRFEDPIFRVTSVLIAGVITGSQDITGRIKGCTCLEIYPPASITGLARRNALITIVGTPFCPISGSELVIYQIGRTFIGKSA